MDRVNDGMEKLMKAGLELDDPQLRILRQAATERNLPDNLQKGNDDESSG